MHFDATVLFHSSINYHDGPENRCDDLKISPLKNSEVICQVGSAKGDKAKVRLVTTRRTITRYVSVMRRPYWCFDKANDGRR